MAIRNVVQVGDDVLRKKCFAVARFDEKLATLLDDMKDTVRKEEGAGLAAPQVGVLRRAVVIDVEEGFFELVNPVIVQAKGEQIGYEGCLSVRGRRGVVRRPMEVTVEFFDRFGKPQKLTARGFFARAVCLVGGAELIFFIAVRHKRQQFGRLAESYRQNSAGKRIQRSGMPVFLSVKQPPRHIDNSRRPDAGRFVNNQPAADILPFFMFHQIPSSVFLIR